MSTVETVPNKIPDYEVKDDASPIYWIRGIPSPLVEMFWHYAIPYVKRALDYTNGEYEHTDLRQFCMNRDMQLWLVAKPERIVGAITTEIAVYPHRKHLRVVTLAGAEFDQWKRVANTALDDFARMNDCNAVECFVRRGFAKKLEEGGYKLRHCVLIKELET